MSTTDETTTTDTDPAGRDDGAGTASRPLDGVVVLDLTRVLSGPHCTRMLHDLGAEVIKIEPPSGDLTRFSTPRRHGVASYYAQQNTGKRNLSVDLATEEGAALVRELATHADVLIENYRPGVMGKLGLGPERLLEENPRLVYASVSGYGQDGPWVHRRAYAPVVEAETGIIASQGDSRGGEYAKDPHSHADVYTALEASSAILAALYQRERTGRGQTVDISMAETMMYVNEHMHDALWGEADEPDWIRSFRPGDYVVMSTADGESLIVSGHPAERGTFDLFIAAMGRPELADDERFGDVASRLANYAELRRIIVDFAATVPDAETFEEIFSRHRLAVGRVRRPGEIADTEWARERGSTVEVDDRSGGTIRLPNVPWRFGDAPGVAVSGVPKYRGEDNRAVLAEHLGYDDERLDRLERDGVISSRLPS
ncbi:CaiB/BaiF CoA transferase family protein [Ilumatobacter sp.]|uniref:CaiB/BaiF CoA transferase family protein n=1 Tax=Ilumatobacter sp. TaxID=1967498 RepID=UPI003B5173CE